MYVAASCSFVNQQTVAAGGDVVHDEVSQSCVLSQSAGPVVCS